MARVVECVELTRHVEQVDAEVRHEWCSGGVEPVGEAEVGDERRVGVRVEVLQLS